MTQAEQKQIRLTVVLDAPFQRAHGYLPEDLSPRHLYAYGFTKRHAIWRWQRKYASLKRKLERKKNPFQAYVPE